MLNLSEIKILPALLLAGVMLGGCSDNASSVFESITDGSPRELESLMYEKLSSGFWFCDCHMVWDVDQKTAIHIANSYLPDDVKKQKWERLEKTNKMWNEIVIKHKVINVSARKGQYKDCWTVCAEIDPESGKDYYLNEGKQLKEWKKCPSKLYFQVFRRDGKFLVDKSELVKKEDKFGNEIHY